MNLTFEVLLSLLHFFKRLIHISSVFSAWPTYLHKERAVKGQISQQRLK